MASTGLNSSAHADRAAGPTDVVVALTMDSEVTAIEQAVRRVKEGLTTFAAHASVRFILADPAATDETREAVREIIGPFDRLEIEQTSRLDGAETPYHKQPRRAATVQAVLRTSQRLEAKVCAMVDAGRPGDTPELLERLVGPVLTGGMDYVVPYYTRHVNEGAITRGIVYPLFRALYGARLRQPAAIEFGCSSRLATSFLEQDFWEREHASTGIDLWLAVAAVSGEFRVCEAALGSRGAAARDRPPDLSTTLAQVTGALFTELEQRAEVWQRVRGSIDVPLVGAVAESRSDSPRIDLEALVRAYRLGYRELREIWTWVLPPRTIVELRRLAEAAVERFEMDDRLWATIVYDFAFGYSLRVMPREHLLRSLTPLYNGWLASFARELQHATVAEVEARVERLCLAFEAEKRYLISRWRWPERFR